MRYAKIKDGDYVVAVLENADRGEEITGDEYAEIMSLIANRQKDERMLDDEGTYRYVVVPGYDDRPAPEPEDEDILDDEALSIITGEVSE